MLLHLSHACLQLWRRLLQMEKALSSVCEPGNVWTSYLSHYYFLLGPLIIMLQHEWLVVADNKLLADIFYCEHVIHQQSVIVQQSAAIN